MATKREVKNQPSMDELWQPRVFFKMQVRKGLFQKDILPFPFICPNIFATEEEAIKYLPFFIAQLIKSGDLPENVVIKDETGKDIINEDILKPVIAKVHMSVLDLDPDDELPKE